MAIKKEPEPKKGAPEWMTTFSDMVTLLLTFFVLLFSFSSIDATKWRSLVSAFTGGSGVLPGEYISPPKTTEGPPDVTEPPDEDTEYVDDATEWEKLQYALEAYVGANEFNGDITLEKNDYQIVIRFRGDVLFDSGKADLKPEAVPVISDLIKTQIYPHLDELSTIRIEGHTDNRPIFRNFRDNLQLSQARSWTVWNYIIREAPAADPAFPAIDPGMVDANGRGEYHPVDTNDTPEGRAHNRRVEFVLVRRWALPSPQQP